MNNRRGKNIRVWTIHEVSQCLNVPVASLYELVKKGKIPGQKIGKHWRFLEEDILLFLKGGWSAVTQAGQNCV